MSKPAARAPRPRRLPQPRLASAITWRICRTCGDVEAWDRENECADGGA